MCAIFLGGKPPLHLQGRKKKWYIAATAGINVWCAFALGSWPVVSKCAILILTNLLLMISVTDLSEKMVYDIHFYPLLLVGVLGILMDLAALVVRGIVFALLSAVFFLTTRNKKEIGTGDTRLIASLALYFSFSRWVEVMLIALGAAAVYGVIGIFRKKRTMHSELPFVPFLLAGVLLDIML